MAGVVEFAPAVSVYPNQNNTTKNSLIHIRIRNIKYLEVLTRV